MRIIDAEPQLITEILDEMDVTHTHRTETFVVSTGVHETLGRMVVIEGPDGHGAVVEMD